MEKGGTKWDGRYESGPDSDPLFYACFECPYEDCRYDEARGGECPFRIRWGRERGVDPEYLRKLREGRLRHERPGAI